MTEELEGLGKRGAVVDSRGHPWLESRSGRSVDEAHHRGEGKDTHRAECLLSHQQTQRGPGLSRGRLRPSGETLCLGFLKDVLPSTTDGQAVKEAETTRGRGRPLCRSRRQRTRSTLLGRLPSSGVHSLPTFLINVPPSTPQGLIFLVCEWGE